MGTGLELMAISNQNCQHAAMHDQSVGQRWTAICALDCISRFL